MNIVINASIPLCSVSYMGDCHCPITQQTKTKLLQRYDVGTFTGRQLTLHFSSSSLSDHDRLLVECHRAGPKVDAHPRQEASPEYPP